MAKGTLGRVSALMPRCCFTYQLEHSAVVGCFVKLYRFCSKVFFFVPFYKEARANGQPQNTASLATCSRTPQQNVSVALYLKTSLVSPCSHISLHLHISMLPSKYGSRLVTGIVHRKSAHTEGASSREHYLKLA